MIRIFCLLHVFSVSPVSATATLTALAATTEISAHLLLVGLISLELLGSHNLLELGVILLLGLLTLLAHLGKLLAHLLGHLGTLTTLAHSLAHSLATAEVRTGTISAVTVTDDVDTIKEMRRLAVYPGICHVRTPDGSSYAADVQVSEARKQSSGHNAIEFSLAITRVDVETLDGMTYAEWQETGGVNG